MPARREDASDRARREPSPSPRWALARAGVFAVVLAAVGVPACSSSDEPTTPAGTQAAPGPGQGAGAEAARGDTGAAPAAHEVAREAAADEEAPEEIQLAPDDSQPPLPDGTFTGHFQGEEAAVSVRLVVRDGMVLLAHVEIVGKRRTSLDLQPVVASDARTLRFQGRFGEDYLRLEGRFVDARRAAGTFEGQVDRKRVSGRWYALRR